MGISVACVAADKPRWQCHNYKTTPRVYENDSMETPKLGFAGYRCRPLSRILMEFVDVEFMELALIPIFLFKSVETNVHLLRFPAPTSQYS